jgi:hypothetical protein
MKDEQQLQKALERNAEAADLDFKTAFNGESSGDWLSLIKDIAAFANTGGGFILVGVSDDGVPTGDDCTDLLTVDPADLTNRIFKYTGTHFDNFEVVSCQKQGVEITALWVGGCRTPLVFTKVGTYEVAPGYQKTAFSFGTIYFRHGAKSEPATSDDLRNFIDRELEVIRKSWLEGITRVVEAPAGSRIAIVPPDDRQVGPSGALPLRLTDDPSAPAYYAVPIDKTHPYRQKEVVREVNSRIGETRLITSHDILCIRRVHETQKDIKLCYTQNYASPRYSEAFVEWITAKFAEDPDFFDRTKARFDQLKHSSTMQATAKQAQGPSQNSLEASDG